MADETIVNKLGFSVEDALRELGRLDNALLSSGSAFEVFGQQINDWNTRSQSALDCMKEMATVAGRLSNSMAKMGTGPAAPATAAPASKLWLPVGAAEEVQKANQTMQNLGNTAADAGNKMREAGEKGTKGGKDAGDAADEAAKKTKSWAISWETLARVMVTQAIVRALSQIRDLLRESVDSALQFSTRISEIQTIAPKIDKDFQGLSREVATIAREFNFPLPDVAEATYQTLSNQFVTTSQRADIMTASAKLAKVGVMDLNEAVLLLTGALNGYGMASSQAEDVAAKFFKTIELGRVRGAELTPVIGRIVPIASELGVSLDEVNASMVALTIGSMKVPEAATAFRAGLTALIKPSEDLKKELHALGFETGQQMIHALGLQETFLALRNSVNGDVAATAELFRNIRGLNAELRLTGSGADQAEAALKAMSATSRDTLNQAYKLFTSAEAQKYTKELNALKIMLATEVGPELVKFLATLVRLAGGAQGLAAAFSSIAGTFTALAGPAALLGGSLAALSLNAKLVALNATAMGFAFNNVLAPIVLVIGATDYLSHRLASVFEEASANYRKRVEEMVAAHQKASMERIAAEKKVYDEAGRRLEQYASKIRKQYNDEIDSARETNTELVSSARATMQAMISVREKVVQQFRAAAQDANKSAEDSMKRQADSQAKLDDLLFKRRLEEQQKYNDYYKKADVLERMYGNRALELAREAATKLAQAETPDQERAAQAIFQRAASYAQEAEQIAKGTDNELLRKQAADTVERIIRKQIAAEKELQQNSAARASAAARAAAQEQERVDRMKVLMKGILADLDLFDKKGPVDPKKTAAMSEDLKKKMADLKKAWLADTAQVTLDDFLKVDALQRRINTALEGGVSEAEIQKLFAAPTTIDDLRAQIEKGLSPVNVLLRDYAKPGTGLTPEKLAGMSPAERLAAVEQMQKSYEQQLTLATKLATTNETIDRSFLAQRAAQAGVVAELKNYEMLQRSIGGRSMEVAAKSVAQLKGLLTLDLGVDLQKDKRGVEALIAEFQRLSYVKPYDFGMEAFLALQEKAREVMKGQTLTPADKGFIERQLGFLKTMADQTEALKTLQKTPEGAWRDVEVEMRNATQEAERLKGLIDRVQPKAATDMGEGAETADKALLDLSQINMGGIVGQAEALADALWDAASASQYVQAPTVAMTAAHGGIAWKFLAAGGPAGTDVIPAMLSPGEVVINAASARRFAAQLTAINAGVQPVYRSEGGSVTNIGDINVTVNGGGTSRQTARAIASELQRELRRGTAPL